MTQVARQHHPSARTFSIWQDLPARYVYALAAALGLALFFSRYPVSFLLGHGGFFETSDPAQHVTGWRYYAQDGWHFPLFHTRRLNYPDGVNIAFTDSIPLAAILFKPLVPWLPAGFHYFGIWHAVVYVSQAVAATFLLRSFGVRHLPGLLAAVIFSLAWPALLWRLAHASLMTHSVILIALGCYVRGREMHWAPLRAALGIAAISLIGLMIHPYLFAMGYALFLMFLIELGIKQGRRMWLASALLLVGSLAATLGVAALLGYIGKSSTTDGFGAFSMNLLAPFCSGALYQCAILPPGSPQGEGVNYLGAGVLLLMVVVLITRRAEAARMLRSYPVLVIGMAGLTFYALSNRVFLDTDLLLTYPLPSFANTLVNTFRASGRFFWPVGYGLLFATLALLLRRPAAWTLPVLALALVVQWVDTAPYRNGVWHFASLPSQDDLQPWKAAMDGVAHINLYPAYGCDDSSEALYSFFQRLGAGYGATLDTGHVARYTPDCPLNKTNFDSDFAPDHLYVMAAQQLIDPSSIRNGFRKALQAGQCGIWREAVVCRAQGTPATWGKALDLLPADVRLLKQTTHWDGAALPTLIGRPAGTRMLAPAGKTGFLNFGPYVTLVPGHYRFAIHYQGDAPAARVLGRWDVQYLGSDKQYTEFGSGPLLGTAGEPAVINGIIDVPIGHAGRWEIRTTLDGQGDVQLIGLDLERE